MGVSPISANVGRARGYGSSGAGGTPALPANLPRAAVYFGPVRLAPMRVPGNSRWSIRNERNAAHAEALAANIQGSGGHFPLWSPSDAICDDLQGFNPFLANQLQPWGTDACAAHADHLLRQLDQLNELGHRVHSKEGQEPAVNFSCLVKFA